MSINWISRNCHRAVSTFAGNNAEDNWINKTWQSKHINNPPLNWIVGEQKNNERKSIIMINFVIVPGDFNARFICSDGK